MYFISQKIAILILFFFIISSLKTKAQETHPAEWHRNNTDELANGEKVDYWAPRQLKFSNTYHVNQHHPHANDSNPGTQDAPLLTISQAAKRVKAGEQVLIHQGTYREKVILPRGGKSPKEMISFEAIEGETVVIKGSIQTATEKWKESEGWQFQKEKQHKAIKIWQYTFSNKELSGYNPFAMSNLMHDRAWLQHKKEVDMWPHFKRRGTIFINGKPLKQVKRSVDLAGEEKGAFWPEHNGRKIHVKFPNETSPEDHTIELTTKEQLFAPENYGTGYIRIKGIRFSQAANGFPVPQRGALSTNRGHHWIIENCVIEWANSVGMDVGEEMWGTRTNIETGYHIIRKNIIRQCGISGLQGMAAKQLIIEDNLFENIGWQDAELAFESGAIKIHNTHNTLIRRNIIRNISFAPGIWLDYNATKNCRITQNVFSDITTARGAVYLEASHNHSRVDHNIFHKLRSQYWLSGDYGAGGSALYTDGTDSIDFDHNLAIDIENTGYGAYLNAERIVGDRGGITRWHDVQHNIFYDCQKHSIEFANHFNFTDYNLFVQYQPGYIKIGNPEPPLKLNLQAASDIHEWSKNSITSKKGMKIELDDQKMILELNISDKQIPDFKAGPIKLQTGNTWLKIDPRK